MIYSGTVFHITCHSHRFVKITALVIYIYIFFFPPDTLMLDLSSTARSSFVLLLQHSLQTDLLRPPCLAQQFLRCFSLT